MDTFFFPRHFFFSFGLAQRVFIDFCQSYCDGFVLGEGPGSIAINHNSEGAYIHTCTTAGGLVAQFLVPFPVNRQRFRVAL